MKKIILFLMIVKLELFAIVNISVYDINEKKEGFYGDIELSFDTSHGNSKTEEYSVSSGISYFGIDNFWLLKGSYVYKSGYINKELGYEEVTNKSFVHLRNVRKLLDRQVWEYFFQSEQNKFQAIKLRTLGGIGVRLTPSSEKFYIGLTPMYVYEEYCNDLKIADKDFYRLNTYLAYKTDLSYTIKLFAKAYYQPNFEDFSDYDVKTNLEFVHKINERLSFIIKIIYEYDSNPIIDEVKKYDLENKTSLVYKF